MKLLMEQWRSFLKEGIDPRIQKQIDALPEDVGIAILDMSGRKVFKYVRIEDPDTQQYSELSSDDSTIRKDRKVIKTGVPHGHVTIEKTDDDYEGPCHGGYAILGAYVERGWGPLLYEVALEWSTENGGGLMPDRVMVSDYAMAVWDKYLDRGDIQKKQLDTNPDHPRDINKSVPQLTPDYERDDCDQSKTIRSFGKDWADSSLSKVYKKNSTEVLDALTNSNRLIIV